MVFPKMNYVPVEKSISFWGGKRTKYNKETFCEINKQFVVKNVIKLN